MNPVRVSPLDIDTDIEGGRRAEVLQYLRNYYGKDRVSNVATFRTEKSKSAILTAARGLGIDVDVAQYIASLIPADRGQLRSLHQCYYGDKDKDFNPIGAFVTEMDNNYPDLWKVAQKIEGLICGSGIHAGGVIFVDEPFTKSTALMRAPDGTVCTQFELHDCEDVSLIKMDLLSVEALDKIHNCLDLLVDAGYVEPKESLKQLYEDVIGIYNLERDESKMWKMVWNHEISSLFQMEKQSGINGIAIAHPKGIDELAVLNSVIRLMAPEKGAEQPLDMWARYRRNITQWYSEMRAYGLSQEEIEWLGSHPAIHDGICESQEGLMSLVQEERLGGHDLTFADSTRKAIAKKQGKLFEECEKKFFETAEKKNLSMTLVHYVWDVLLKVQRGYSFCAAHTHAYSLIALQEMNLAYRFPIIFWNTACLIADSGGMERADENEEEIISVVEETYYNEMEEFSEEDSEDDVEDSYEEGEDCDGYPATVVKMKDGKKKKKVKATNYGKIAAAIGKMMSEGISVSAPNINFSSFTFSPDVENNTILHGLSGITRIGEELIQEIIKNRPYSSLIDFLNKVKINKPQMVNLIKSGAFDAFYNNDRIATMDAYMDLISDKKSTLNLRNAQMLIKYGLIPAELDFQRRVFNFNKYLKNFKVNEYLRLDEIAFSFFNKNFDIDLLKCDENNNLLIKQSTWKKIYDKEMVKLKNYIKDHLDELLDKVNAILKQEVKEKYCEGTISSWEMQSMSCYLNEHELVNVNNYDYDFSDFNKLPDEPIVETTFKTKDGKIIPILKLHRITGTVLDRDKGKKTVTLLTTTGVVTVKIFGEVFAHYDRQISQRDANGVKHVVEASWFSRGQKIIVTGIRRGDAFIAKKYSRTPYHIVERISNVDEYGNITIQKERVEVEQ